MKHFELSCRVWDLVWVSAADALHDSVRRPVSVELRDQLGDCPRDVVWLAIRNLIDIQSLEEHIRRTNGR